MAWSVSQILEFRSEPYVFKEQTFKIVRIKDDSNHVNYFVDASEKLISHGAIKRIMARTGEIAITYDNGKLVIIGAHDDNKPTLIVSPNHTVQGFLPINIQTLEFPIEKRKEMRKKEIRCLIMILIIEMLITKYVRQVTAYK